MKQTKLLSRAVQLVTIALTALTLAACGGGASTGTGTGTGGTGGTGGTTSNTGLATLDLAAYPTATSITSTHAITAGSTVRVKAVMKNAAGAVVPNALVTFSTTAASLASLSPAAGTVLTDQTGTASIDLIAAAPNPGGAFSIKAAAVAGNSTATAVDWTMSVGVALVTVGSPSHTPATTAATKLQSGSTVTIQANVTSAGNPVNGGVSFTASSPCASQGKAVITPIGLVNGVFTASYKNNGCGSSPDTVTLAQVGGSATTAVDIHVQSSSLAEIRFINAIPSTNSLVIKGGGGYGRVETGSVTFELLDNVLQPIQGAVVNFSLSSTAGGLNLVSPSGVTGVDGRVTATVRSGTSPTPFVVSAKTTYTGGGQTVSLSASSTLMNISVGLPEQKNMSMSATAGNIEGLNYDGTTATITLRLADFWGNRVADGTAINMISEGGAIGSSSSGACTTVNGTCSLDLSSQSFKPANGRVTVTAYTEGPLSFNDISGVGDFTAPGTTCYHYGDPFLDYDESGTRSTTANLQSASSKAFTSINPNLNIAVGTSGFLPNLYPNLVESYVPYNGSAYTPPTSGLACGNTRPLRYIQTSQVFTFSGSTVFGARADVAGGLTWPLDGSLFAFGYAGQNPSNSCSDGYRYFYVFDENLNPMPAGTTFSAKTSGSVSSATVGSDKLGSTTAVGGSANSVSYKMDATKCAAGEGGSISFEATTPKGNKSNFVIYIR